MISVLYCVKTSDEIARRYNLKSADTESKETDHEEA